MKETKQIPENYDQIIDNVREFVGYLEGKNIINPRDLQSSAKVKELQKQLVQIDLSKFNFNTTSKPASPSAAPKRKVFGGR